MSRWLSRSMKPDGGLVEDVQDPDQPRTDLSGEADSLRLSPGQAGRPTSQTEIVEADIEEELQPGEDLLEHPLADLAVSIRQLEARQHFGSLAERQGRDLMDVPIIDRDRQRGRVETGSPARITGNFPHVLLVVLTGRVGGRVLMTPAEKRHGSLKGGHVLSFAAESVDVGNLDLLVGHPVHEDLPVFRGQILERNLRREAHVFGYSFEDPLVVAAAGPCPGQDGTVVDGQFVVGDDQVGVDLVPGPDARAFGARSIRAVERKVAWLQLLEREPAVAAREVLAEGEGWSFDDLDDGNPFGQVEGRFEGVGQAPLDSLFANQPIDDNFDRVLVVPVELDLFGEFLDLPVDARPGEALPGQLLEKCLVFALAAPHHRCQDLEPGVVGKLEDLIDDLLGGLAGDGFATVRAVRRSDAGKEKP